MTKQKQKGLIHSNYSGNAWLDVKMREKVKTWSYSTDNKPFFFLPPTSLLWCGDISSWSEPTQTQKHDETSTNENMEIYITYENIFILNSSNLV